MDRPTCPYCGKGSDLVSGTRIYPHRSDLAEKNFYLCAPCNAYVGCHPGTVRPLGRLADAKLRSAKKAAHDNFDRLWKSGTVSRSDAYSRLSAAMQISPEETHIGMFNVEQCLRVVDLVQDGALEAP